MRSQVTDALGLEVEYTVSALSELASGAGLQIQGFKVAGDI